MKDKLKKLFNYFLIGIFAVIPIAVIIKILFFVKDLLADMVRFVYGYADSTLYTVLFLGLSCVVLISIGYKLVEEGRFWVIAAIDFIMDRIPFLSTIYRVLKKVNGAQFEGHTISVEVSAAAKSSGPAKKSNGFSKEKRGFGGGRSDRKPGSQGGFNKRRRDY